MQFGRCNSKNDGKESRNWSKMTKFHKFQELSLILGTCFFQKQEFEWDNDIRGYVASSYFVGYFFTQIPGGFLAAKYRANM
jgi:hypothetical protein